MDQFPSIIFSSRSSLGQLKKSVLYKLPGSVKPPEAPRGEDLWEPSLVQGHALGVSFALTVKTQSQVREAACGGGSWGLPSRLQKPRGHHYSSPLLSTRSAAAPFLFCPDPNAVPIQPLKVTSGSPRRATFNRTLQGLQKWLPMVAGNSEHTKTNEWYSSSG